MFFNVYPYIFYSVKSQKSVLAILDGISRFVTHQHKQAYSTEAQQKVQTKLIPFPFENIEEKYTDSINKEKKM